MPRAAIDLGSHSILLLVQDEGGEVLHDEARVVGLGAGLGKRGLLDPSRKEAALEVLHRYAHTARHLGVDPGAIAAAATSAVRRAHDGETFVRRIRETTGIRVAVIPAEEEARLTALGALSGLDLPAGDLVVVDPGGGSTEIVRIRHPFRMDTPESPEPESPEPALSICSLPLGTVRLTEERLGTAGGASTGTTPPPRLARARAYLDEVTDQAGPPWDDPRAVVAVGGTATALAALERGLSTYDPLRVHGTSLDLPFLRGWGDRFRRASLQQRRALLPASPNRASTILAGTLILEHILERARRPSLKVSHRGLRFGLLRSPGAWWFLPARSRRTP